MGHTQAGRLSDRVDRFRFARFGGTIGKRARRRHGHMGEKTPFNGDRTRTERNSEDFSNTEVQVRAILEIYVENSYEL